MIIIKECKTQNDKLQAWNLLEFATPGIKNNIPYYKDYTNKVFKNAIILSAVENAGGIIGIVAFYANDTVSNTAYVTQVAVHPDYRRKGIGKH